MILIGNSQSKTTSMSYRNCHNMVEVSDNSGSLIDSDYFDMAQDESSKSNNNGSYLGRAMMVQW